MTGASLAALNLKLELEHVGFGDRYKLGIIQSALDEARNDALEEAAKMVEGLLYETPDVHIPKPIISGYHANEIRKLKTRGNGND